MAYQPAKLKFVSFSTLLTLPEPEMLIEDLVPTEGIIMLSADPNIGKTFAMVEMVRALATGSPFLGKFKTRRAASLFIGQDASVLDYARQVRKVCHDQWKEHEALLEAQRADMGDHPSLTNPFDDLVQYILQPGFYLEDKGHVTALIEAVNSYEHTHLEQKNVVRVDDGGVIIDTVDNHKSGFDVIFFDTFASMKMLDENDNSEMQICLNNARAIATQTGAAVIFSHHHDKVMERLRGASAIAASADVHIELKRKKEGRTDQGRFVDTLVTLRKFRGMKIDPFMYRLYTTTEKATFTYQDQIPQEGEPPTEGTPDEAGITYERAAEAWCHMLAASERGTYVPIKALLAHIRTLGSVNSRTMYRWMERFRSVHTPVGYIVVAKQAIRLTDEARVSALFSLDTQGPKE